MTGYNRCAVYFCVAVALGNPAVLVALRIRYRIALAGLGLLLLWWLIRTAGLALLSMGGRSICPRCGTTMIQLSSAHSIGDRVLQRLGCPPHRCRICGSRFYRPRISNTGKAAKAAGGQGQK